MCHTCASLRRGTKAGMERVRLGSLCTDINRAYENRWAGNEWYGWDLSIGAVAELIPRRYNRCYLSMSVTRGTGSPRTLFNTRCCLHHHIQPADLERNDLRTRYTYPCAFEPKRNIFCDLFIYQRGIPTEKDLVCGAVRHVKRLEAPEGSL